MQAPVTGLDQRGNVDLILSLIHYWVTSEMELRKQLTTSRAAYRDVNVRRAPAVVTRHYGVELIASVSVGSNASGSGDTQNPDLPNWNPDFHGPVILGRPDQWFDARAFVMPLAGTFGNIGRGQFTGPALSDFDTSLFKKFSIDEKRTLQFRTEAFNVFNHANFGSPNPVTFSGNTYSSAAGVITSTSTTSRQIQFALKLLF